MQFLIIYFISILASGAPSRLPINSHDIEIREISNTISAKTAANARHPLRKRHGDGDGDDEPKKKESKKKDSKKSAKKESKKKD